jgi:hypothetical protein
MEIEKHPEKTFMDLINMESEVILTELNMISIFSQIDNIIKPYIMQRQAILLPVSAFF